MGLTSLEGFGSAGFIDDMDYPTEDGLMGVRLSAGADSDRTYYNFSLYL